MYVIVIFAFDLLIQICNYDVVGKFEVNMLEIALSDLGFDKLNLQCVNGFVPWSTSFFLLKCMNYWLV